MNRLWARSSYHACFPFSESAYRTPNETNSVVPRAAAVVGLLVVTLGLPMLAGCSKQEPITRYTVDTRVPPQLQSQDRMLAAMVPKGSNVWFFKVVGPDEAVEAVADEVQAFVQGVRFEGDQPAWDLPATWKQRPSAGAMRFATIDIPTELNQLELSISQLPRNDAWDEQVASNVNRWRGQLGLQASQSHWADAEPLEVAAADAPGAWVDLTGEFGGGPTMGGPMIDGGPLAGGSVEGGPMAGGPMTAPFAGTTPTGTAAAPPAAAGGSSPLEYEMPEGWREGRSGGMRLAAFVAGDNDAAEITVIAAGGDLRSNVARWLQQLRGAEVADDVVDAAMAEAQDVRVGEATGKRFVLVGEGEQPQAMDITVIPQDNGMSLFVKMTGPADVVREQNQAMAEFLASLQP